MPFRNKAELVALEKDLGRDGLQLRASDEVRDRGHIFRARDAILVDVDRMLAGNSAPLAPVRGSIEIVGLGHI